MILRVLADALGWLLAVVVWSGLVLLLGGCATGATYPAYPPAYCLAMGGHMNSYTEYRSRSGDIRVAWCCIP